MADFTTRDLCFGEYFAKTLRPNLPETLFKDETHLEADLYDAVLARNPRDVPALKLAGHLYTTIGEYRKGLEADLALCWLCPEEPLVWYNLGCSHALLDQPDEAFAALDRSVDLGYKELKHISQDKDLGSLRQDPRYTQLLRRIMASKPRRKG